MGESSITTGPYPHQRWCNRLAEVIDKFPNDLALECVHQPPGLYRLGREGDHGRWSYRDLDIGITRLMGAFERLNLSANSLIFVLLGNSLEHVLTTWAGYRLGCVHISIHPNSLSNAVEARHLLQIVLENRPSPSVAVVVQNAEAVRQFDQIFPQLDCVKIVVEDDFHSAQPAAWTSFGHLMQEDQQHLQPSSVSSAFSSSPEVAIFFSSGTTSLPKPCVLEVPTCLSSLAGGSTFGTFARGDRVMSLVPCSHLFGYIAQMYALAQGSTLVYPSYLSFEPHATMATLRNDTHQYLIMVSALVHAFLTADLQSRDLRPIGTVIFAGMALSTAVAKEFQATVGPSSIENLYGMTEGVFCSTGRVRATEIDHISHEGFVAVGRPVEGSRVKLCAPGTTEEVVPGVAGEVHYSGRQTIQGYLGVPSDSFYADSDGCPWYRTGDQAILKPTDGSLYPVGRYKELIIRGGKNLSPAAIEGVLNLDPTLRRLNPQVVPLPDSVAGEVPVIVVNTDITPSQTQHITQLVLSQLGSMYLPDRVLAIQKLGLEHYPRTSSGKVQKVKLADLVRDYHKKESAMADEDSRRTTTTSSTVGDVHSTVTQLWAEVMGVPLDELNLAAKLSERVDSITQMRVHSRACKRTGKIIPFASWAAANSISEQIAVLETAGSNQRNRSCSLSSEPISNARNGPPEAEDIVHLLGDARRFPEIQALVNQTISGCGLTWQDVEDVFPATDFQHIMRQAHLIESWEFWVCVHTRGYTTAQLRHALETTMTAHPMLRSFVVLDDDAPGASETLQVIIRHTPAILDRCIVDYGEVDTLADIYQLIVNFPAEHRIKPPGPLFRGLLVFVKEISSAVLIADFCHSIMDATYHEIFEDDLDLALGGLPLEQHIPYKAWTESYYLLQDSRAARAALEYHRTLTQSIIDKPIALWPTPSSSPILAPEHEDQGFFMFEFSLPTLLNLRDHHSALTTSVVFKSALALLTVFHTKHPQVLLLNIEAARSRFPFLPASVPGQAELNGSRVAGATLAGTIEHLHFNSKETVLDLLYRVQQQQIMITQYANAPWRELIAQEPRLRQLYADVANHVVFNWTGSTTFKADKKRRLHEHISRQQIFFRNTTGLMIDAGASGKDGIDFCITLTGAVANSSPDWIGDIARGLQRITTWLVQPENWERPVGAFRECLQFA
ncbi:putative NRPS-like protein biosynthetic cluster [Aspergillus brasiliensis]|nr:putative NRPS-like protein biosynthetic cluster [Aspergillus brasiliensis]